MKVWLLERSEDHGNGRVVRKNVGLYADRTDALRQIAVDLRPLALKWIEEAEEAIRYVWGRICSHDVSSSRKRWFEAELRAHNSKKNHLVKVLEYMAREELENLLINSHVAVSGNNVSYSLEEYEVR